MKKSLIALAIMVAVPAFATTGSSPPAQQAVVTAGGSNTVYSSTGVSATAGAGQASSATATNTQQAASWVSGSGSLTVKPATQYVTQGVCAPVSVNGTLTSGNVVSSGGVLVSGSSTASVTGTGQAQALGGSYAVAAGNTTLTSGNFALGANGNASGSVVTNTGVITSGSSVSSGATGASWNSTQTGTLFTYNSGGVQGDVKNITSTSTALAGKVPVITTNQCGGSTCTNVVVTPVGANTVVSADAFAGTFGQITNTFGTMP